MAAALDWFVRLRDEPVPSEDRQAFARWRDADPRHAEAFAEVELLWADMDAVQAPRALPAAWDGPVMASSARRRRGRIWAGGIAAALLFTLVAPQLWLAMMADERTGTGEVRQLTLSDGSRVALDAQSAIAVSINADGRKVRLLEGRAWFAIAHEARPFTVAVGDAQIRDIGTAFEVTRRGGGGEVAVTDGVVELTAAGAPALRLERGQAARFSGTGGARLVQSPLVPLAWRGGRLQFVNATLSDILDDLSRYGAGRPLLMSDDLARRRITGAINLADPEGARDAILARVDAQARRIGPFLLISRR